MTNELVVLYDYTIRETSSDKHTQWTASPAIFEAGPKVKRPILFSNDSHEHLTAMIRFVVERDESHIPERWSELIQSQVSRKP